MSDQAPSLDELRQSIDAIDREVVALLNKRAELSQAVGRVKADASDVIFKPAREKAVIANITAANRGPLGDEHLGAIWAEIFSASRALQRPQRVAYLGPEGTFSYFAGHEFLGHSADYRPMTDIAAVFRAVAAREVELGVIPLENSLQGTVGQSLDLFLRHDVHIQTEVFCRISHALLTKAGSLADIRSVYSHPQPLAQCGQWLRANLPGAGLIPLESTAASARKVAEDAAAGDLATAAIGHRGLAAMHNLTVAAVGIEDAPDNWTRFVVIAPKPADADPAAQEKVKTSLLFTLPDEPGSLARVLAVFAEENLNMNKLESRPLSGEKWQYVFFVDVQGDLPRAKDGWVLKRLREACHSLKILGSYPAGPELDVNTDDEILGGARAR